MNGFQTIILQTAPRLLGLMDRSVDSKTFGCCDRNFWNYKIHDLSNARFQEISLFLTLLYANPFEGNRFCQSQAVREWILASIKFWATLIQRGGYVSEVYPFERSFCATAFSTFSVVESLMQLSQSDSPAQEQADRFLKSSDFQTRITSIGNWLSQNCNNDVANQMTAAALALSNVSQVTNRPVFQTTANEIIARIVRHYEKHGHYNEYGGFDIGYTTITNSLLFWYAKKVPNKNFLLEIISKNNERIDQETDLHGLYDSNNKSRKTQFLFPSGFLATNSPVFHKISKGVLENSIITPLWLDDRYCIGMAIDYLKTLLEIQRRPYSDNLLSEHSDAGAVTKFI